MERLVWKKRREKRGEGERKIWSCFRFFSETLIGEGGGEWSSRCLGRHHAASTDRDEVRGPLCVFISPLFKNDTPSNNVMSFEEMSEKFLRVAAVIVPSIWRLSCLTRVVISCHLSLCLRRFMSVRSCVRVRPSESLWSYDEKASVLV